MLAWEIAKEYGSAVTEVTRTAEFIRFTAEQGKRMQGETLYGDSFDEKAKNKISIVTREPLGVILAIAPFNYPVNLSASKIAPGSHGRKTVFSLNTPTQGAISALLLDKGIPDGRCS